MGNDHRDKKETKNDFLKMSRKKAPIQEDERGLKEDIKDVATREAKYINQVVRRDIWQG